MKNFSIKKYFFSVLLFIGCMLCPFPMNGQTNALVPEKNKKAWEFGAGINGMHLTRFSVTGYYENPDGSYSLNTNKRDILLGGHLYVARELNTHFYVDWQTNVNFTRDPLLDNKKDSRWMLMTGLGIQWRLGEYFHSSYIDPYVRLGVNYMYKDFLVGYDGASNLNGEEMNWALANNFNREGSDKKHLIPIAPGVGINMWLNDRLGIGLQADYLVMPHRHVANMWQGTVRLMWRFGGKSKKPLPEVQYVDRVVERIVVKEVPVEVPAETPQKETEQAASYLCNLINCIYFDFDKSELDEEAEAILDEMAAVMKRDISQRYLITGFTDARGSQAYNQPLSERRAKAIAKALVDRGVPKEMLKVRGVGKKIAHAAYDEPHKTRRGDRKITLELVRNGDYWKTIPELQE